MLWVRAQCCLSHVHLSEQQARYLNGGLAALMRNREDFLGCHRGEVDRRYGEVRVTELPLQDVDRDALAHKLDRVAVAQLMRGDTPPDRARSLEGA